MEKPFLEKLEAYFEAAHRYIAAASVHWREHTNRRTVIIVVVLGILFGALYLTAIEPPAAFPAGELVTVPEGQGVVAVSNTLYQDGVIRSPLAFRILVTLMGRARQLRAGDYLFKQPESVFGVARAVSVGAYGLEPFRIRVAEGATVRQMADLFDKVLPRFDSAQFVAEAQPREGYFFPDTYFFLPNASAQTVEQAMQQNFESQIATIQPQLASSTHSLADIVIMASIIEREAPDMQDRRLIAGVLWRRIKQGMALQSDVTSLYTLPKGQRFTAKVLDQDTPYNTYLHRGLPPTAIGNPSLDSILAAASPIDKGYLFYLADSSGVTHYCKTYSCQLSNQRAFLR